MKKLLMLMSILAIGTVVHAEKVEFEAENIINYDVETEDFGGETKMSLVLNCQKIEGLALEATSEIEGTIVSGEEMGVTFSIMEYGIEEDLRLSYAVMEFLSIAAGVNYDRETGMAEGDVSPSVYVNPSFTAGMLDVAMENEFRFADDFLYYHDVTIGTELEKIGLSLELEHELEYVDTYSITETQTFSKGLVEKGKFSMAFDLSNELGIEEGVDDIAGSLTTGFSFGYGAFSWAFYYTPSYTPEFTNSVEFGFVVGIAE